MRRLLFLTVFLPAVLQGQDTTSTRERKFFIGVNFSPDYCYRYIAKNINTLSNEQWAQIKNQEDSIYKPTLGFTTGVNFVYQVNKHIGIETGVQYSRKGYQSIPVLTVYDINYFPAKATNYIYFTYIDVPLRANFSFLKSKLQIIAGAGVVYNFLLEVRSKTVPEMPTATFQTQNNVSIYPYSKLNFSTTVSAGLKYNFSDRINVRAEPTFRYGLLNIDYQSYIYTHLWSAGINFSFNYGL